MSSSPSKPSEIGESVIVSMKDPYHLMKHLLYRAKSHRHCLDKDIMIPTDSQSSSRPLSANEQNETKTDMLVVPHVDWTTSLVILGFCHLHSGSLPTSTKNSILVFEKFHTAGPTG
ncbi:hypothetical protein O181_068997 [Austropuccinia psidii MF-1]|uniref:Uncharacterized protein n=1 Tax=Austropuccinia psidii MF-1 TaxID=1389203 RepID=A0A9Q3F0F2_9BASI|nr:hypothetical protein [Austropuccinia psidii MF-1]